MLLADKKRDANIAEYIIYMYQTEDLIRLYEFKLNDIEKYVISHLPVSEEEKKANLDWYEKTANEMKTEGLTQNGHLGRVEELVKQLTELHEDLMKNNKDYLALYNEALPFINNNINLSEGKITNPIQICLNGIYGLLLLRMNGKKIDDSINKSLEHFGNVLSYLSYEFKRK